MRTTRSTSGGRAVRAMMAGGLALLPMLAGHPTRANAFFFDPQGTAKLVTGKEVVTVVTEDELSDPATPRGCGGCGSGHYQATCLESHGSCSEVLAEQCSCVANSHGLAVISHQAPAGVLSGAKAAPKRASIAQMVAGRSAILFGFAGADEKSLTLVASKAVAKSATLTTVAANLAGLAGLVDQTTGGVGVVVIKVAFDNSPPSAIDETLSLAPTLETVSVAGPLGCAPEEEEATLRVTLTQEGNGAIAQGVWRGACTPADRWKTEARVGTNPGASCVRTTPRRIVPSLATPFVERLMPGPGEACALAEFRRAGRVTRTEQWCNAVELLLE